MKDIYTLNIYMLAMCVYKWRINRQQFTYLYLK